MIRHNIAEKVLTIGCKYKPPKGGIAQVLSNYDRFVFPNFKFIKNSNSRNLLTNLAVLISGIIALTAKCVFDRKIKIVHIHTASYNSFRRSEIFLRIARLFRKKVILHIHGGAFKEFYNTNPDKIRHTLQSADTILTLSTGWLKFFTNEVKLDNVVELKNIIAPPSETEKETRNGLSCLFLGLITPQKGIYDLLEVMRQLCVERHYDIHLHIGGNGDTQTLQEQIKKLQLQPFVHFHGWVSGDKKRELLTNCDLYILPSYIEGLPVSILEAMSYGKPVIATNVGAIPEVIRQDHNGTIIQPGNLDMLRNAIVTYAEQPRLLQIQGNNAHTDALNYLPQAISDKLEKIYQDLL